MIARPFVAPVIGALLVALAGCDLARGWATTPGSDDSIPQESRSHLSSGAITALAACGFSVPGGGHRPLDDVTGLARIPSARSADDYVALGGPLELRTDSGVWLITTRGRLEGVNGPPAALDPTCAVLDDGRAVPIWYANNGFVDSNGVVETSLPWPTPRYSLPPLAP